MRGFLCDECRNRSVEASSASCSRLTIAEAQRIPEMPVHDEGMVSLTTKIPFRALSQAREYPRAGHAKDVGHLQIGPTFALRQIRPKPVHRTSGILEWPIVHDRTTVHEVPIDRAIPAAVEPNPVQKSCTHVQVRCERNHAVRRQPLLQGTMPVEPRDSAFPFLASASTGYKPRPMRCASYRNPVDTAAAS